jgi:hypothetical protein
LLEYPVPIPEPKDELCAFTDELAIETIPIDEMLSEFRPDPVPIPEPNDEEFDATIELQILRSSILEVPAW